MKKFHKVVKIFLFLLFAVVVFISVSCSKNRETNVVSGTKNQIFHLGNGAEPEDLDPHITTGMPEHYIISSLLEGLVTEDPATLAPLPGMAESWSVSEDLTIYTFKIGKNRKWSNGDQVLAHDFVYSWKRLLAPKLACQYSYSLYCVKNAEKFNKSEIDDFKQVGVRALDDYTLEVTLIAPTPYFLSLLVHHSTFPVHRGTIEKFGKMDERGSMWTRPGNFVGNGPFVLKNWELNKVIIVKKNPEYWEAEKVRLNEIRFYPIDDLNTEERMFRAGQLHSTGTAIPIEKIAVYKKKNPGLIHIDPFLGTYFYRFNVTRKPFDDVRVRRALAMSINRKQIVEKVTKGGQLSAYSFTPPDTMGYTPESEMPYDVEAAKGLLAEAGYPDGKGFPTTEILYNTNDAHRKIAVAIQQMWKTALNIDITLVNQDWKVYLDSVEELNYFISRAGWIGDYPDPNTFLDMFLTGGGNNNTGWSNKVYDDVISQASRTANREERYSLFQKAEKILLNEAPIISIYTYTIIRLISPDVKGWYPNVLDHHPYKYVYLSADK
ncbi:MAG: peptide ABC transporter substrate-binding protein [Deltaproteobacteria bacterium]|nr:peptide ABC transporter substrate-binding protein [Deltaproteobacteria bacterium]